MKLFGHRNENLQLYTFNDGILCHGGENWLEELGATEEDVAETLMGKRSIRVRDIRTFYLFTPIRVIYSIVQYTVLLRSGKIDVMSEVDQMVMFYLMTSRRINLVRLILHFIISVVGTERRRHATLPYGMFLRKVLIKA